MLESGSTRYRRNLFYVVSEAERPVLHYSVVTDNTQPKAEGSVDLANRHVSYEMISTSMRQIADPSGKCLRNLPLDLLHVGDAALLIAVTDDEKMPPPENFYLHLWHATYYTTPPKLPAGIDTMVPRIGCLIYGQGQNPGRISQRDGRLMADINYNFGTSQGSYRGPMVLEQPVDPQGYGFSGAICRFRLVLSKQPEVTPFLQKQVDQDREQVEKSSR